MKAWRAILSELPDIVVILNPHAKGVTEGIVETLSEVVSPERLFLTQEISDNAALARQVLEEGVHTVFTGGGDGTIVAFVNALLDEAKRMDISSANIPQVGVMRLGTGNALAEMVSSGSYLADLRSFLQNPHEDTQLMAWVESEGRRFPFGGIGLDAEVLNDYEWVKEASENTAISPALKNVGGYFAALFSRTIPRRVREVVQPRDVQVLIRSAGSRAFLLNDAGERVRSFEPGEVMFEGTMNLTAVGTCPYYGYGMKVLPYATEDMGMMNIRVVSTSIQVILANLRAVWDGTYRHEGITDFLADVVEVEMSEPLPYQEGGDAKGERQVLRLAVGKEVIRLVRFI